MIKLAVSVIATIAALLIALSTINAGFAGDSDSFDSGGLYVAILLAVAVACIPKGGDLGKLNLHLDIVALFAVAAMLVRFAVPAAGIADISEKDTTSISSIGSIGIVVLIAVALISSVPTRRGASPAQPANSSHAPHASSGSGGCTTLFFVLAAAGALLAVLGSVGGQ